MGVRRNPPVRTCEPVMMNTDDLNIVDAYIAEQYGEDVFKQENRRRLVTLRKEAFHLFIVEGAKFRAQNKEKGGAV